MNPANFLTSLRLLLGPAAVWAIIKGQDLTVLTLLALAALTDVGDGWLARRRGQVTRLGTLLDPIADKTFIGCVLIGGALTNPPHLPGWLAAAYVAKELIQLAAGAFFLRRLKGTISANRFGKTATLLTFAGFFLLWLGAAFGWWVILAGLLLGLYAAGTYLRLALAQGRNEP